MPRRLPPSAGPAAQGDWSRGEQCTPDDRRRPLRAQPFRFTDRITADGRDGWPVEAGRYRLVVSRACPWASRALVTRRLMGLEDAISLGVADPIQDDRSWRFTLDPGDVDPVLGIAFLGDAYVAADPDYDRRRQRAGDRRRPDRRRRHQRRLPADARPGHRVAALARDGRARPLPGAAARRDRRGQRARLRRPQRRRLRGRLRDHPGGVRGRLPPGVRAASTGSSERLAGQRYLVGDTITEADIRLFTTLIRFDAVYHGHFKCNRNKLTEMPVLWAYLRDLFQTPGFGDTVDFDHIKRHYYQVHTNINPTAIVPAGPDLSGLTSPHGRDQLPAGRSATAPRRDRRRGEVIAAQLGAASAACLRLLPLRLDQVLAAQQPQEGDHEQAAGHVEQRGVPEPGQPVAVAERGARRAGPRR